MIPTGYSYWCSHLNQTTHIAQSPNHFPYSVALGTKDYAVSRLCTRAPEEAANRLHFRFTLSYFRSLFYGLYTAQYLYHSKVRISSQLLVIEFDETYLERIIQFFQRTFQDFS